MKEKMNYAIDTYLLIQVDNRFTPVNLRVLDGPDQTNCNRIIFTAIQTMMVYLVTY